MPRRSLPLLIPDLDHTSPRPLHLQLYAALRDAILTGRLTRGGRIPASRALAAEVGVSRNTVITACDQLLAEGYVESRAGSGIFVTRFLPDQPALQRPRPVAPAKGTPPGPSRRGNALAAITVSTAPDGEPRAFRTGVPALDVFPIDTWARLASHAWRTSPRGLLGYGDAAGYEPLRLAIADYLRASRAVVCDPSQVLIVAGSQEGVFLAAQVLLDPGDHVWFEEPGYRGARTAIEATGVIPVPVPIDRDGLQIEAGERRAPRARAVYVTPSHQYPLGVTMSLARRLELLAWARRHNSWIIEDDYDSEYRYKGRPITALQGLDADGRVLYIGTFSKVLCPALRVGYLVVPPTLVNAFTRARTVVDRQNALIDQVVLSRFLAEGHFARHIRRTRRLYEERQSALVDAARQDLRGLLDVEPHDAGLHLVGWLPPGVDDRAVTARAREHGVEVSALSAYYTGRSERPGLVLGYAGSTPQEIASGVARLGRTIASVLRRR